ncbi:MAG TPA: hypothetical protein VN372_08250 [Methanospirillum sp.]|nr:hypothetical protein [Methanospirillum sp.]
MKRIMLLLMLIGSPILISTETTGLPMPGAGVVSADTARISGSTYFTYHEPSVIDPADLTFDRRETSVYETPFPYGSVAGSDDHYTDYLTSGRVPITTQRTGRYANHMSFFDIHNTLDIDVYLTLTPIPFGEQKTMFVPGGETRIISEIPDGTYGISVEAGYAWDEKSASFGTKVAYYQPAELISFGNIPGGFEYTIRELYQTSEDLHSLQVLSEESQYL